MENWTSLKMLSVISLRLEYALLFRKASNSAIANEISLNPIQLFYKSCKKCLNFEPPGWLAGLDLYKF